MAALATARSADKHSTGDATACTSPPPSNDYDSDRLKAAEFIREAEKNRRLIEKLEKERTLNVQCRKNDWTVCSAQLEEYEKVLEEERNADKINLQKQLLKIHNGVRKFQRLLVDVKPTSQLIERLKEVMSEVEMSINTLKEEQRSCFETLLREERTCRHEITAYEKRIENWCLTLKSDPILPTTNSTKPPDRDVPAEVRALEAFLQRTGPYGGWDQYDHQAFLKVWTKYCGQPAYRKEASLYLPGKTSEDMEQHEDWHQQLLYLQDRKREAIQRWKASKNQERQNRIQCQEEAERREKEAKTQVQQQNSRTEEERRKTAQRLEQWREERRRKTEQEEEQKMLEEMQKRRQEKEERRRQLEVKLIIEEQLHKRKEEDEQQERWRREEEEREINERRREATKGIKRFNERDLHKVQAKLQEKQLRDKEEEERQKKISVKLKEKVDGHISRDPSRLIRPTKGWEERMKHVGPSGGGPLLHMFHRAVPTWRQGL